MVIKRKSAIYSVIALMLCVAVYLNWSYQRAEKEGGQCKPARPTTTRSWERASW